MKLMKVICSTKVADEIVVYVPVDDMDFANDVAEAFLKEKGYIDIKVRSIASIASGSGDCGSFYVNESRANSRFV